MERCGVIGAATAAGELWEVEINKSKTQRIPVALQN